MELLNEALRSPNHKTCFSFALKCIQDLHFPIHFGQFGPVSTQPHQNGRAWCKSCVHLRAKLKHVLWLGDLKASLKNAAEKSFHKTSSTMHCFWKNAFSVIISSDRLPQQSEIMSNQSIHRICQKCMKKSIDH